MTTINDANKLSTFIKTHFQNTRFSKIHLSELSKILVGKILHQIELAANSWKINETFTHHTLSISTDTFPKGRDFHYIIPKIKESFENLKKIGKTYSFRIGSRIFHIHIIQPIYPYRRLNHTKTYELFDQMIEQIYIWLYVASHFSKSKCSPDLSIYIYLTDLKKTIPELNRGNESEVPISQEHANTAFTMACPAARENEITIFRKEEWFKVLIHETFHSLGLDFATLPEKPAIHAMFSIFPIKCDLRLYETYCESWAEIINVVFVCVKKYRHTDEYRNNSILQIPKLVKMIENGMHTERIFSVFQSVKVLAHYKLTYTDLYDTTNSAKNRKRQYTEKTSVFSYYILKSIVLFYYNDFIEWCSVHNRGTIQFKKMPGTILKFVEFIKQKYNLPDYLESVRIIEEWFSNNGDIDEFIQTTLRMSVSE